MTRPKLTLYVDVVSPFAYLAFHVINTSPAFKQCDVKYIPILLGGVMKACNNTPPLRVKNKDKWINKDRIRWARHFDVPILETPPTGFPTNTVSPMRALAALELASPDKVPAAMSAMYKTYWVEGKAIDQPDVFGAALATVVGEKKAQQLVEAIGKPEVKQQLTKNTEQALAEGAFGLPYYVAINTKGETETFFGFDHLGQVVEHLGLEKGNMSRAML